MEQNFRALQNENYQLREYILNLQSRLLENQTEPPPAPPHIQLQAGGHASSAVSNEPQSTVEQQLRREMHVQPDPSQDAMRQLAAAAQAGEARQDNLYGLGRRGETPDAKTSL